MMVTISAFHWPVRFKLEGALAPLRLRKHRLLHPLTVIQSYVQGVLGRGSQVMLILLLLVCGPHFENCFLR